MTLQDLFNSIAENPSPLLIFYFILPFTAIIANVMSGDEAYESPWKYLYSALVYLTCVPGILALVLCVYTFTFESRQSLLEVNALVYFLPIIVMAATLIIMSRKVDMRHIPGFSRLSGLMFMLAATFITILIIQKTRIWVMFHGSVTYLLGLFVVLFLAFMWGWNRMIKSDAPTPPRSSGRNTINID